MSSIFQNLILNVSSLQSHWNQYFSDDELQGRIMKDVVRAFPDIEFFQHKKIQSLMVNILFNYARENSQIEYKQGMHEILGKKVGVISIHIHFIYFSTAHLCHSLRSPNISFCSRKRTCRKWNSRTFRCKVFGARFLLSLFACYGKDRIVVWQ